MSHEHEDKDSVRLGIVLMVGYPLITFLYAGIEWLGELLSSVLGELCGGVVLVTLPFILVWIVFSLLLKGEKERK